jgi:hypothetical protein
MNKLYKGQNKQFLVVGGKIYSDQKYIHIVLDFLKKLFSRFIFSQRKLNIFYNFKVKYYKHPFWYVH